MPLNQPKKILFTYSNNHEKMCEEYMNTYSDALVFDKKRRSIYAQNQEFGYISNVSYTINLSDITPYSNINYTSYNGYISFSKKEPEEKTISSESNIFTTVLTYREAVDLMNTNQLIKGHKYIINDYQAITTQELTIVANTDPYYIMLTAISPNKFDPKGIGFTVGDNDIINTGSFNLNSKIAVDVDEIWYDITNNTDIYSWGDRNNGKGIIYRIIDKYNNDICFDFKHIAFSGEEIAELLNANILDSTGNNYVSFSSDTIFYIFFSSNNVLKTTKIYNNIVTHAFLESFDGGNDNFQIPIVIFLGNNDNYIYENKVINNIICFLGYNSNKNYIVNNFSIYLSNSSNNYLSQSIGSINGDNNYINGSDIILSGNNNYISNSFLGSDLVFCKNQNYNRIINSKYISLRENNSYLSIENSEDIIMSGYCTLISINNSNDISFQKDYIKDIIIESGVSSLAITTNETTNNLKRIQNIKFCSGLKNKTVTVPVINQDYQIEYKPNTTREYVI